ncbi:MAG: inositol monophosphatase family protein [Candidatus Helarchaeota archaeon]
MNIWDVAAGILLIKEAGGKITDFKGDKFILDRKNKTLLASNNRIHNNLLNFINNTLEKYNYKNF